MSMFAAAITGCPPPLEREDPGDFDHRAETLAGTNRLRWGGDLSS